ncbi:MAG: SH3 domain-containing protein [Pseudomonadota bacterium]
MSAIQLTHRFFSSLSRTRICISLLVLLGLGLGMFGNTNIAAADGIKTGRETGLPIPRFVSLKSKAVNLRVGPGRRYAIAWHYRKHGLPVEVIQEFDQWRRIRDSEGTTGWVLHSLLSNRRTAIVAPWDIKREGAITRTRFVEAKHAASSSSDVAARLEAGLVVDVDACTGKWCQLEAQSEQFWLEKDKLWGVYPDEKVDG